MDQIRTEHKDKIPKGHSFPLKNATISKALIDVPQYFELKLHFRYQDIYWASDYNRKLKEQGGVSIFEIGYEPWYGTGWAIQVTALPKDYILEARQQLIEVALPEVRLWLLENASGDYLRLRRVEYSFDLRRRAIRKI